MVDQRRIASTGMTLTPGPALLARPTTPLSLGNPPRPGLHFHRQSDRQFDPDPQIATESFTLIVAASPVQVVTTSLPEPRKAESFGQSISESGGAGPFTSSISAGSLPDGMTLTQGSALRQTSTPLSRGTHLGRAQHLHRQSDRQFDPDAPDRHREFHPHCGSVSGVGRHGLFPGAAQGQSHGQSIPESGGAGPLHGRSAPDRSPTG